MNDPSNASPPPAAERFRAVGTYRKLLHGLFFVGGASVINIVLALLRSKTLALVTGPSGVAAASLWTSFVATATAVGGVGVGVSGAREVSLPRSAADQRQVKLHLRFYTWTLAALTAAVVALLSKTLVAALGDAPAVVVVGLAVPVAASILSQGYVAELRGAHQIRLVAKVKVLGGVVATVAAVLAVVSFGISGLWVYVASVPIATSVFAWWFARETLGPRPKEGAVEAPEGVGRQLGPSRAETVRNLVSLGVPAMSNGVLTSLAALAVKIVIEDRVGLLGLGLFAAAFSLATQHIGLILQAMATDYLPRLAAVIDDREHANEIVHRQTRLLMTLGFPTTFLIMALAQWLLPVLYSAEFGAAEGLLRLFLVASLLRMLEWPLGYVLLAAGRGWLLTAKEIVVHGSFVVYVYLWLGDDLNAVGYGFLMAQALNIAMLLVMTFGVLKHRPSPWTISVFLGGLAIGVGTLVLPSVFGLPWLSVVGPMVVAILGYLVGAKDVLAMFAGRMEKSGATRK